MSVILDFISLLRYFGLPVSPDETIAAQKVYTLLVGNRNSLFWGLRSTIVKRFEDFHVFELCFKKYFEQENEITAIKQEDFYNQSKLQGIDENNIQKFLYQLNYSNQKVYKEIGVFLIQDQINQAIQTAQTLLGKGSGASSELDHIQEILQRGFYSAFSIPVPIKGLTPNQRKNLSPALLRIAANIQMFIQGVNRSLKIDDRSYLRNDSASEKLLPENISQTDRFLNQDLNILSLSLSVPQIKEQLIEIGKILASREKRRRKRAKKGKLDFRRTFRKNLSNNGIPISLVQKKKRIIDPELIVLNDISGSTRWIANWFFVITYAASDVFKKIRLFEFDNIMVEVTEALSKKTINRALDERENVWKNPKNLPRKRRIHSDYETSLKDFFELTKYRPITKRTTILILGDIRDHEGMWTNRGGPISAQLLRKIAFSAKRVLILNPEDKSLWNTGDSVVDFYREAGAEIFQVSRLQDLINLVYDLKN